MRLIDADALHAEISEWPESVMYKDWVQSAIANAPTIAPQPNDPLTLEELREIDGGPVFIKSPGHLGHWALVHEASDGNIYFTASNGMGFSARVALRYGGKVYRRKPEDGTK